VWNAADGSVRALFAGPALAVAAMLMRCRAGPALARVDAVDQSPGRLVPEAAGFRVTG